MSENSVNGENTGTTFDNVDENIENIVIFPAGICPPSSQTQDFKVPYKSEILVIYDFLVKIIKKSQFLLKNSKKFNLQKWPLEVN